MALTRSRCTFEERAMAAMKTSASEWIRRALWPPMVADITDVTEGSAPGVYRPRYLPAPKSPIARPAVRMEALALRPAASSTDQRSPQASPSPWCTWTMVLMPSSQGRGANQDQEMLALVRKPARAAQHEGQVLGQTGIVTLGD